MKLTIDKGDQWPVPLWHWKRIAWNWPPVTNKNYFRWRCSVDFGDCPSGTSIKLVGIGDITPFNRLRREHWSHWMHGTSDRWVAVLRDDGIHVGAYGYRQSVGGVTGSGKYLEYFSDPVIQNGETFDLRLTLLPEKNKTVYTVHTTQSTQRNRFHREQFPWLHVWSFPHASGDHGNVAPADIQIEARRIDHNHHL